ncbi:Protein of unknown function [Gryllus bimaculatus]|nr:Protein of unknown function [Gryllus bimaculatus]
MGRQAEATRGASGTGGEGGSDEAMGGGGAAVTPGVTGTGLRGSVGEWVGGQSSDIKLIRIAIWVRFLDHCGHFPGCIGSEPLATSPEDRKRRCFWSCGAERIPSWGHRYIAAHWLLRGSRHPSVVLKQGLQYRESLRGPGGGKCLCLLPLRSSLSCRPQEGRVASRPPKPFTPSAAFGGRSM